MLSLWAVQHTDEGIEEKAKSVTEAFPKVRIVIGGLDDSKILEDEAAKADVVIRKLPMGLNDNAVSVNDSQTLRMHLTTKAPRKRSQRVCHLATPRRSLDSGCTLVALVSCAGRLCETTTSWANGRNVNTTIGQPCKT